MRELRDAGRVDAERTSRARDARAAHEAASPADAPQDRWLTERCILFGATVPMLEMLPDDEIVTEAQPSEPMDAPDEVEPTQEPEVQADTWVEQMQVRMDRLMDDIHNLNDRLDRLENKTKV